MCVCADPKISTLTPNGHLDLAPAPNLDLYLSERLSFALDSNKSSVSSLGRASLEQTALVSYCACCSQPAIHYRVLLTERALKLYHTAPAIQTLSKKEHNNYPSALHVLAFCEPLIRHLFST